MKKIILTAGVFFIAYVVFSAVIVPQNNSIDAKAETVGIAQEQSTRYIVKSENDKIVVYIDDALYLRTNTPTRNLPKQDQTKLLYGIVLTSKDELKQLLEDYCS